MVNEMKINKSEMGGVSYRRSKTIHIIMALLTNASTMAFFTLMGMMSYLANEGYGIAVAAAGFIISATRVFDGVIDPLIAFVIDRLNTPFGKIRIILAVGWVVRTVATLLLFVWGSGHELGIIAFVLAFMLYIIGNSTVDIAGNIIGPVMTNDPKQRPLLGVWSTLYSYLFGMGFNIAIIMYFLPKHGNQYNVAMMADSAIFFIIVSFILLLLAFIGISPIDKMENFKGIAEDDDTVKFKDMWQFIKENRPFTVYLISASAEKLAQVTAGQAVVSVMLYGILMGDLQFGAMLGMISMVPGILFAIIGGKYAGKHGNKKTIITWSRVCILMGALNILFLFAVDMRSIPGSLVLTIIFFALMLLANGTRMCITLGFSAMRADIIDYELDRSGKYIPGTVTATYNLVDQIISSLGAIIAGVTVAIIGYTAAMPQATDEPGLPIFIVAVFLFHGLYVLAYILMQFLMKNYKLSKEEMVAVQKRIQDRKGDSNINQQ